jgi:hypothetical protein
MDILCIGMYRSCSTWQYNVACELIERHQGGTRLGFMQGQDYRPPESPESAGRVLKSHQAHERFAAALSAGEARALYSERDLRDVAFSLAHKLQVSFEEIIAPGGYFEECLVNDAFWVAQPNLLRQRYENLIVDWVIGVKQIALHLGVTLAPGEAEAVAAEYSLRSNRERAEEFAQQLRAEGIDLDSRDNRFQCDPNTLLHWNHLRTGRVGSWREDATPAQLASLGELCGQWLIERGYEADLSWVDRPPGRGAEFAAPPGAGLLNS